MIKLPFILWFLTGSQTTLEDETGARELRANVHFRNGSVVPSEGALEACDGVAGHVPPRYAAAFPTAQEALAKYDAAIAAAAAKVDGVPTATVEAEQGAEKPTTQTNADKVRGGWKPNA